MKTHIRRAMLLAAAFCLLLLMARSGPPANGISPKQLARLKQRIDALLQQRLRPEPLPVLLPNPFRVVSGGSLRADDSDAEPPAEITVEPPAGAKGTDGYPPGSNQEALAQCIARIRIGGTVALRGQLQIVINDSPRKEGDIVVLDRNNAMTYLHIVRIRPGELTLRLNDATQTIRF
jgi:hypothetical protein